MRYKEFAIEALKPSQYRNLVKGWDKTKYAELFGGQYRIYIPLESAGPATKQVKINPRVSQEVEKLGYKIDDYLKGIASKNENGRVRQIKIGKLLTPSTAQVFANDPGRQATKKNNQMVVISRHPYDIAGMSTDRGWRSCMNLDDGQNREFVPLDIKAGTVIAYLIDANDKNIENPQARMLIKPFVNIMGNHEIALGIENKIYGTASPGFRKTVSEWVNKINASHKLNGIFELDPDLYDDNYTDRGGQLVGDDKSAWLKSLSLEQQLLIIEKNPSYIRYIKNPTEEVQLAAVSIDGSSAIKYIKRPSENVQIAAVNDWGANIRYIIKSGITPSESVQETACGNSGNSIKYIIKAGIIPSESVQETAAANYGIRHIINAGITPSETVQRYAVKNSGHEITYIINAGIKPSEEVQKLAVSFNGNIIRHIISAGINPSEDVQLAAVKKDPNSIEFISSPSEAVKKAAVGKLPFLEAGIK